MTAAVALVGISATLTLAIWALVAMRQAGRDKARADVANERLAAASTVNADLVTKLKEQTSRADRLDALLADYAVSGPVIGSYERLLQKWKAVRADAHGDGSRAVPDAGADGKATGGSGPDDLMRPGD